LFTVGSVGVKQIKKSHINNFQQQKIKNSHNNNCQQQKSISVQYIGRIIK
jgi:hypothetical protein